MGLSPSLLPFFIFWEGFRFLESQPTTHTRDGDDFLPHGNPLGISALFRLKGIHALRVSARSVALCSLRSKNEV